MASARILVIGGGEEAKAPILQGLGSEEFELLFGAENDDGVGAARKYKPDLLILNQDHLNLDILKNLRTSPHGASLPIILLSPLNETMDKVLALELGADDYLPKPFDPKELLARVRAALRRVEMTSGAPKEQNRIIAGGVELDPGAQKLLVGETSYSLSATETALLKILMENKGQVVSRERILDYVWGEEFAANPRVVDVYISSLRKKCFSNIPEKTYIRGIRGAGYRFEDSAAPRVAVEKGTLSSNIPYPSLPFVGREEELKQVARFLRDPASRLLTLAGLGGIGKTRLACEAAAVAAQHFRHGACFVSLVPLMSAAYIVPAIAEALKLSPDARADIKARLLAHLRDREMLLLLDSFEHLLEGAEIVSDILAAAPAVKILCTSRERLNLHDETVIELGGMDGESEGIQLFLQGARRLDPEFVLSAEDLPRAKRICKLIGGVPLGIELAAAWVKLLPCEEIAREIEKNRDFLATSLRDVPERHKSLRAAFEWSWNCIPDEEKKLFSRLSVFRGGFTRDAAEKACGADLPRLLSLTNKSLVGKNRGGRYEIHEVLKEYAMEKLRDSKELETYRRRHAEYFLERMTHERRANARRLDFAEAEHDNLRAALRWALDAGEMGIALRLSGTLAGFWTIHPHYAEGRKWIEEALLRSGPEHDEWKPKALLGLAEIAYRQGDFAAAAAAAQSCKTLSEARGDRLHESGALTILGNIASSQGDYPAAMSRHEEALEIRRKIPDEAAVAASLHNIAIAHGERGDYDSARRLMEESLFIRRKLGSLAGIALALISLGATAVEQADFEAARQYYVESIEITKKLGDKTTTSLSLSNLAEVAVCRGDLREAERLLDESIALAESSGSKFVLIYAFLYLARVRLAQGRYDEARAGYFRCLDLCVEQGQKRGIASILEGAGWIACGEQRFDDAARLLGAADRLRRTIGTPIPKSETTDHRRVISELADRLGEDSLLGMTKAGAGLSLDDAIALLGPRAG